MPTTFTQTDTDHNDTCAAGKAPIAIYCSSASDLMSAGRLASVGGSAGSVEVVLSIAASATDDAEFSWLLEFVDDTTPDAGDWTFNFDFTSGGMFQKLVSVAACRLNSTCVDQSDTIVEVVAQSIATDEGDKAVVINQAGAGTFNNGDKVLVVCGFSNSTHGALDTGITPSLTIVSPWTAPAAGTRRIFVVT